MFVFEDQRVLTHKFATHISIVNNVSTISLLTEQIYLVQN